MSSFKCRIINKTGSDVLVRIVGFKLNFCVPEVLKNDDHYDLRRLEYFPEGEYVGSAFDDFEETVVCTKQFNVKGKTKITLQKSDIECTELLD